MVSFLAKLFGGNRVNSDVLAQCLQILEPTTRLEQYVADEFVRQVSRLLKWSDEEVVRINVGVVATAFLFGIAPSGGPRIHRLNRVLEVLGLNFIWTKIGTFDGIIVFRPKPINGG